MAYDPQKADLVYEGISLRGLIAWLETKPSDEEYDYGQAFNCAAAQYLQSIGRSVDESCVNFGYEGCRPAGSLWLLSIVKPEPTTFGAALERARAALASRS